MTLWFVYETSLTKMHCGWAFDGWCPAVSWVNAKSINWFNTRSTLGPHQCGWHSPCLRWIYFFQKGSTVGWCFFFFSLERVVFPDQPKTRWWQLKHVFCSSLFGEDSHFFQCFQKGLKPPTRKALKYRYIEMAMILFLLVMSRFSHDA